MYIGCWAFINTASMPCTEKIDEIKYVVNSCYTSALSVLVFMENCLDIGFSRD